MGNKLGRKRQVVDEKYTKPQGLYPIKDVDYRKLRKLILESKLAPCYPGDDDECNAMEECPICFLHYPTLNRSRCCLKSICTECFLQMKDPHSNRPTQCPFCKASNYAVEYRGGKSKEEQGLEQIEEQKVIEAKIRMRQQELLEEEERMLKRQETSSYSGVTQTENFDATTSRVVEGEASVSSQNTSTTPILGLQQLRRHHRDDDVDLDLEDIMLMEAIWLSIQENGGRPIDDALFTRNVPEQYSTPPRPAPLPQYSDPSQLPPLASSSSISPSGGLAYSIASLAEQQQSSREPSSSSSNSYSNYRDISSLHNSSPSRNSNRRIKACYRRKKSKQSCDPAAQSRNIEEYLRKTMVDTQSNHCGADWGGVNRSEIVEVGGTSYGGGWSSSYHHPTPSGAHMLQQLPSYTQQHDVIDERFSSSIPSSDESDSAEFAMPPPTLLQPSQPPPLQMQQHYAGVGSCVGEGSYEGNMACPVIPETFEEQMMLAMAVSLAEARAASASQGVVAGWH